MTALPVPPRARSAGFVHSMPRQRDLHWKAWSNVSNHNVMHLGTRPASKGLPRGPGAVIGTLNKIPKTTHPLTDPKKFAFDAWMLSNEQVGARLDSTGTSASLPEQLLYITVHGEFAEGAYHSECKRNTTMPKVFLLTFIGLLHSRGEAPSQGVRSFTRTFLVAPVPAGSTAANLGWPCVIISDQLTVRHYAGTAAWDTEAAAASSTPAPAARHVAAQTGANGASASDGLPAYLQGVLPAPGMVRSLLCIRPTLQT